MRHATRNFRGIRLFVAPVAVAMMLTACGSTTEDRVGGGAALGAVAGAGVGALFGGVGILGGTMVGAGVGAATGAVTSPDDIDLGEPVWNRW